MKTKKKWRQYGKFIALHPDEYKSDCLKGRSILSKSVSISSQNLLIANPCIKNSRYWWKSPRLSAGNQSDMNIMGHASVSPQSAKMSYWLQKQSLNTGGNRRSTKKVKWCTAVKSFAHIYLYIYILIFNFELISHKINYLYPYLFKLSTYRLC